MPIETGYFQSLRPVEMPNYLDSQNKAMAGTQLGLQNMAAAKSLTAKDYEAKAKELDFKINQAGAIGNLALGAVDQPSYDNALKQASDMGIDVSSFPKQMPERSFLERIAHNSFKQAERLASDKLPLEKEKLRTDIGEGRAKTAQIYHNMNSKGEKLDKSLTPGEKIADQTFGKDASEYYYSGGKSAVETNLKKLQGAIGKLEAEPDITGGFSTKLPWFGNDEQQDWVNPKLAEVRDDIRGAIQGTLRQVLGPQFTEKEGTAIFSRAFNPRLSAAENVRRANIELEGLRAMAENKDAAMAYFKENGTLKGFQPGATALPDAETAKAPPSAPRGGGVLDSTANAGDRPPAQLTPEAHSQAIEWAKKNLKNPDAREILKRHRML